MYNFNIISLKTTLDIELHELAELFWYELNQVRRTNCLAATKLKKMFAFIPKIYKVTNSFAQ